MSKPLDIKPTFVSTPKGDELVILTRAHYERLVASERSALKKDKDIVLDAQDDAVAMRRRREWAAVGKPSIPLAVVRRVRAGDSYLKAMRTFRKMTQSELSEKVGITQSSLSEIESGRRPLNRATGDVLARALDMHPISLSDAAPAVTDEA